MEHNDPTPGRPGCAAGSWSTWSGSTTPIPHRLERCSGAWASGSSPRTPDLGVRSLVMFESLGSFMPQLASGSQLELPHQGEQGAALPRVGDDVVAGRLPASPQRSTDR